MRVNYLCSLPVLLGAHQLNLAPGTPLDACLGAGVTQCVLGAGVHRGTLGGTLRGGMMIKAEPGAVLLGSTPVPAAGWEPFSGKIWRTTLQDSFPLPADPSSGAPFVEQLLLDDSAATIALIEARWPNLAVPTAGTTPADAPGGPLDRSAWGHTLNGTDLRAGVVAADRALFEAATAHGNGSLVGGIAVLNVGYRFRTWARPITASNSSSFSYDSLCASTGRVGGTGNYLDRWDDGLFYVRGLLALLDAPGEWWFDAAARQLYLWMPDSGAPAGRVGVKTRDMCVDLHAGGGAVTLANLTLVGCALSLRDCSGCSVSDVSILHAGVSRSLPMRGVTSGPTPPSGVLLAGNRSSITRLHLRSSETAGLKVVGDDNRVTDSLIEEVSFLGSLDFPALEIGFGFANPTARGSGSSGSGSSSAPENAESAAVGVHNHVENCTFKKLGNAGIVTSQLANTVTRTYVHHAGLIGLDSAGIHADNTPVSCMNFSMPAAQRANCTKVWSFNWVHDCTEKCMRGDDFNLNLTAHHNVLWNCGMPLSDANTAAASGFIVKGDSNAFYGENGAA